MDTHQVVSSQEWQDARVRLLAREKELTRLRELISAERRALPWVRVTKPYVFDTPDGARTLAELFDGRSQLIVKHFMFGPDWEEGCVGCSFLSDHLDGWPLTHRWRFRWVSSFGSDFNRDFHVTFTAEDLTAGTGFYNYRVQPVQSDEMTGMSVFFRDPSGAVFHTYSCYARSSEAVLGIYALLDLTPKGREETINGNLTDWVRHHDRYGEAAAPDDCCAPAQHRA